MLIDGKYLLRAIVHAVIKLPFEKIIHLTGLSFFLSVSYRVLLITRRAEQGDRRTENATLIDIVHLTSLDTA